MTRRSFILFGLTCLTGCQGDGQINLLGYSSAPPFDPDVRSVYVPVFKNPSFLQTTPLRGLEVDITRAVVKELGARPGAPRVISDPERADTELIGELINVEKRMLNQNQQNMAREMEIVITVKIVWRDLRSGRVLSNQRSPRESLPPAPVFDPSLPPLPEAPVREVPVPVMITASGRLIPEVGETNTTAQQSAVDRLARQIVNMMEAPW